MDSAKLPFDFDPQSLQRDLRRLAHVDWIDHFVEQNYEGSWTVIPLRGPKHAVHPVMMIYSDPGCTEFADTPFLDACPYFQEVMESFQCQINAVRLMRLTPGSVIKEHIDYDLALEDGNARMHIPITTGPKVEFSLNNRRIVMNEGECWYLRLSDPHTVSNSGNEDRVHLVIDASVNAWLRELIDLAD
jgi:mannose-6-phosphate isomerase-like protein (cupin superfamily)